MRAVFAVVIGCGIAPGCSGGSSTHTEVAAIATVAVTLTPATLVVGQVASATASARDANGAVVPQTTVLWSSSNTAVATVASDGAVSTLGTGTVDVIASATSPGTNAPVLGRAPLTVQTPTLLARRGHAMAYDVSRQRVVLFGGIGPAFPGAAPIDQASAWTFDGTTWLQLTANASGLTGRNANAFAYDEARGALVVFGGRVGTQPDAPSYGDTWELQGTAWTRRALSGPPTRSHATAAFDAGRGRVQLLGGVNPATFSNYTDQWEWDGTTWAQRAGITTPFANTFGGPLVSTATIPPTLFLSRESDRKVLVYRWSANAWNEVVASVAPIASAFAAAPAPGGGILLFGGATSTGVLGETWKWDGTTWTKLNITGPPARTGHAMAFDAARNRVVLFGGESSTQNFADTWEFDGTVWRQISTS